MIHQIMETAARNGNFQLNVLEQATHNFANLSTAGYKTRSFAQYITPQGVLAGTVRTDTSQGPLELTNRELDIAIKGDAYIPVTNSNGETLYTRDGSFKRNSDGVLTTRFGDIVGHGIQLPVNYKKLEILKDGTVQIITDDPLRPQQVGKLKLVAFRSPDALKPMGENKYAATRDSGEAVAASPGNDIIQGYLERSNVSPYAQIEQVLRLNAGIISNLRIVKFADEIYRQSANLRQ